MSKSSRKQFLTTSLSWMTSLFLIEGGLSLTTKLVAEKKTSPPLPEGLQPVSESDPTAKALGYHQDAKHTDFNLYPERKEVSAKNQFCKHCAQYTKLNEGWGKCNIITAGIVSSNGWCSAWSQRS
ncbi:high-potential iron-sulfur protein [Leptospira sp. 2 VSF19]|uniref:High-potential iron-sulfur protein n=1 Tax=Leptospira soteropolitanensis TaxID=2950025 RepID=A0AAW5VEG0_9LEPT|nr:high-potential iron-sulfur protein [Leptospira soteropolitanensis]MCW7493569.1 high-potential iron-sulfur protein [Leptospira soteropolitanensis]MCW7501168.1 high-potential iron-sulfur protein [Leptospira soteropolitanensis]MCW7523646.1 high-potential iron-sulfur protein [Leptospira soteropolitanensis]MCW7527281.1 high-potential iron-sulfur protein [Leptospira soteropolitanensis]MCW7531138.1 high-potential iron-sulfur protein [Leptospira soteropolitanensis]